MIRRNPGTFTLIISLVAFFIIGLWQAMADAHPAIERSVWIIWGWSSLWWITYFHARWIEGIFKKLHKKGTPDG